MQSLCHYIIILLDIDIFILFTFFSSILLHERFWYTMISRIIKSITTLLFSKLDRLNNSCFYSKCNNLMIQGHCNIFNNLKIMFLKQIYVCLWENNNLYT